MLFQEVPQGVPRGFQGTPKAFQGNSSEGYASVNWFVSRCSRRLFFQDAHEVSAFEGWRLPDVLTCTLISFGLSCRFVRLLLVGCSVLQFLSKRKILRNF